MDDEAVEALARTMVQWPTWEELEEEQRAFFRFRAVKFIEKIPDGWALVDPETRAAIENVLDDYLENTMGREVVATRRIREWLARRQDAISESP